MAATPPAQLVEPEKPKKVGGLSIEQMARMGQEMSLVQSRFKAVEQSYNRNVMNMVLARGYIAKLVITHLPLFLPGVSWARAVVRPAWRR